MKNSLTITAILALHLAVGTMLILQPGCNSTDTKGAPNSAKEINGEIAANKDAKNAAEGEIVAPPPEELPEGSAALRIAPTRPAWSMDNKKGEVLVKEELAKPMAPKSDEGLIEPVSIKAEKVAANTQTYTVKKGDSLGKIAKKYSVSVAEIKSANNLTSNSLKVNQELQIPVKESAEVVEQKVEAAKEMKAVETSGEETVKYTVKKGDSLSKIAVRNHMTIAQVKSINNLKNDNIRIGQTLLLNKSAGVAPATEATPKKAENAKAENAKAEKSAKATQVVSGNFETYTVKSGDTLGAIARKNGVSLSTLEKNNPNLNPKRLRIGQVINIKAKQDTANKVEADSAKATSPIEVKQVPVTPQPTTTTPTTTTPNLVPSIKPDSEKTTSPEPEKPANEVEVIDA